MQEILRQLLNGTKIWHPYLSNLLIDERDIGDDCVIHSHVWIGHNVKIGNRVKIQAFVFIPDGVTLEDDVFIGPHVCFTNDPKLETRGPDCWAQTVVKKGAKIGANASILAGVTIGENAIVGMGSVVLHDVPPGETWIGNPAYKKLPLPTERIDVFLGSFDPGPFDTNLML